MKLAIILITVVVLNIPFGYWRSNVRKFSLQWILAIHIPVILGIMERLASHLEFSWATLPLFVLAFLTGQYLGFKVYHFMKDIRFFHVSSCFVMDCWRNCFTAH